MYLHVLVQVLLSTRATGTMRTRELSILHVVPLCMSFKLLFARKLLIALRTRKRLGPIVNSFIVGMTVFVL